MNNVAIITARGGSKRIPRKNIREFCGQPIIKYSIDAALDSGMFDEVMVSTDDTEIAEYAVSCGASVPFMRSKSTANDFATTNDVLLEVINRYITYGKRFDKFCCIYPTAPFITSEKIREAMELADKENVGSVIPVVRFSFPPQRGVFIRNGYIEAAQPECYQMRSQDLEPMYHDCGLFYCAKTESFLNEKKLVMKTSVSFVLPEEMVQDIDTLDDWKIAEMKYIILRKRG